MPGLQDSIQYVTGVGPKRAELLSAELSIQTIEDLMFYFPYKHIDRTRFFKLKELQSDLPYIQVKGRFVSLTMTGGGKRKYLTGLFSDETGVVEVLWFKGEKYILTSIQAGKEYVLFGKPSVYQGKVKLIHPEIEDAHRFESGLNKTLQPQYSVTEKLKTGMITSRSLMKIQEAAFKQYGNYIRESLSAEIVSRLGLMPLKNALLQMHFPTDATLLKNALFRLKFEELFYIQLGLLYQKSKREKAAGGFIFERSRDNHTRNVFRQLPFPLTSAQIKVLSEIRSDVVSGKQMNRLLQGDVGSGKTLVAMLAMLMAIDNDFQACIMVPTEILARQHFITFTDLCEKVGISVAILTGSSKKKDRRIIHENLLSGDLKILIGTHALIEDQVQFKALGLVVIDEQHRFGVVQRARLWRKNENPPHVLVMTATPIPRTLAMTLYGDLDVSVIDELPPGRIPVKTVHYLDSARLRLFGFLEKEIAKGRQVYVVFPLIKESETLDYKDLEDGLMTYSRAFPSPKYYLSIVHGQMRAEDKGYGMKEFVEGKSHMMIATTVIEVGVNVPNATVMVIESADRFGLSQLHQLRGRVGRGGEQSWCILLTPDSISNEARKRIQIMVSTNDGFEIAETDLILRGAGEIEGTQQSGQPMGLKVADLGTDGRILQTARHEAGIILDRDPLLETSQNKVLLENLKKKNEKFQDWSRVS